MHNCTLECEIFGLHQRSTVAVIIIIILPVHMAIVWSGVGAKKLGWGSYMGENDLSPASSVRDFNNVFLKPTPGNIRPLVISKRLKIKYSSDGLCKLGSRCAADGRY